MTAELVDVDAVPVRCTARPESLAPACQCPTCRKSYLRFRKLRDAGVVPPALASADLNAEAWLRLLDMHGVGWTSGAIASATGVDMGTIGSALAGWVLRGEMRGFSRRVAVRLTRPGVPVDGRIGAAGTVRRVRAMAHAGWSADTIAARSEVSAASLRRLAGFHGDRVTVQAADAVAGLYRELGDTVGPSWRGVRRAIVSGWAPRHAWAGVDIDDPRLCLVDYPRADVPSLTRVELERLERDRASARARKAAATAVRRAKGPSADQMTAGNAY